MFTSLCRISPVHKWAKWASLVNNRACTRTMAPPWCFILNVCMFNISWTKLWLMAMMIMHETKWINLQQHSLQQHDRLMCVTHGGSFGKHTRTRTSESSASSLSSPITTKRNRQNAVRKCDKKHQQYQPSFGDIQYSTTLYVATTGDMLTGIINIWWICETICILNKCVCNVDKCSICV